MKNPNIADNKPLMFETEAGKSYAWCSCGLSKKEGGAFCDGSHIGTDFTPHIFVAEKTGKVAICMCKHTGNKPLCDGTHAKL
ncbi:MAG: CDGSH iron-sulfur domain-containing protein [Bacteroidales bacterium]|nr:CDGSH iron-sulfur domain-containing protein [Bacteroidales bacterium]